MSLSDVEIAQVAAELEPLLRGTTVGKIYQPDEHTLLVELGRERLLIAAHPRASRLHLADKPAASGPPPAFAMLLRKRLSGLRLRELTAAPGERVVALGFGPERDRLVAELTGPHANVFLVDSEGKVAGAMRRSRSTTRALAPGLPYAPPPPAPADARWRGRRRFGEPPGVAARVADHYQAELRAARRAALTARAGAALARALERVRRRERALESDLARIAGAAELRKRADLLLAHAHEIPGRGATRVTVPDDFEDGAPLTIDLDPALDVRANAGRYYRQHKRLTAGRKHAESRLRAARSEAAALEERLAGLAALDDEALAALVEAAPRTVRRRSAREPERLPYRELRSRTGETIWVGRSAADNDVLTFRHARGGDLWLHTRDAPGSHVVVPLRAGKPVSEPTLVDAAMLAAHHSPLRGESQVDVLYTHVKNVRKPRGAPPGRVSCSASKTIRVRLEPEGLARLGVGPRSED